MLKIIDTIRRSGEHLELNNALLVALKENDEDIIFYTSEEYWKSLGDIEKENIEINKVNRIDSGVIGILKTIYLTVTILINSRIGDKIIFLSSITYNSLFLSVLSNLGILKSRVIIVLHEVSYLDEKKFMPKIAGKILKIALKYGFKNESKFLIIGPYIKMELDKRIRYRKESIKFLDHPIIENDSDDNIKNKEENKIIKIASIGVQTEEKNSNMLEKVVMSNIELIIKNKIKFSTIGRLEYKFDYKLPINHMALKHKSYLIPIEEYKNYILNQDYLIFFLGSQYDLKTSGTIIEALKFKKPIIAIKSNIVKYYFEKYGFIGYMFENIEELEVGVERIIKNFDQKIYKLQVKNICKIDINEIEIDFKKQIKNLIE